MLPVGKVVGHLSALLLVVAVLQGQSAHRCVDGEMVFRLRGVHMDPLLVDVYEIEPASALVPDRGLAKISVAIEHQLHLWVGGHYLICGKLTSQQHLHRHLPYVWNLVGRVAMSPFAGKIVSFRLCLLQRTRSLQWIAHL